MIRGSNSSLETDGWLPISELILMAANILGVQCIPWPQSPVSTVLRASYSARGWFGIRTQPSPLDWLLKVNSPGAKHRIFIFVSVIRWKYLHHEIGANRDSLVETIWDTSPFGWVWETHFRPHWGIFHLLFIVDQSCCTAVCHSAVSELDEIAPRRQMLKKFVFRKIHATKLGNKWENESVERCRDDHRNTSDAPPPPKKS